MNYFINNTLLINKNNYFNYLINIKIIKYMINDN